MSIQTNKKPVVFAAFALLVLVIFGVAISISFYFKHKNDAKNNNQEVKSEDINVNYTNKKTKEDEDKISRIQEADKEYQAKVTGFNPSNYDMPKPNLSNANEKSTGCVNGFGGQLSKIDKGLFSEPLYTLDAEKLQTDNGGFAYAPYVNAYYVIGDILFKKPLDLFDRNILTTAQLNRNFSDSRVIIGNQSYKNSYSTMESKFGFPQAYLKQQSGLIVSLSAFNDGCIKAVGNQNITFDRIDLSGIPVTALFSSKFQTTLHHGANGLYSYTASTTDYVSSDFVDWIHSNNMVYQKLINNRQNYTFPAGAYLYVPVSYSTDQETVSIDFKSPIVGNSLDVLKEQLAKDKGWRTSEITFIREQFKDFEIYKPVKVKDYSRVDNIVFAEKSGKFYIGSWDEPAKINFSGLEPNRSNLVVMNQTALASALKIIKSNYQGAQFDVGTDNENLDVRVAKAQTTEESLSLQKKKEFILKSLNAGSGKTQQH